MSASLVVVDSAIWIDHINRGDDELIALLKRNRAAMHPMIYGEIALGSLKNRKAVLRELRELPHVAAAPHAEVFAMIEWLDLFGKGVGFIDVHLIAATRMIEGASLYTRDKRLRAQAERLGLAYSP